MCQIDPLNLNQYPQIRKTNNTKLASITIILMSFKASLLTPSIIGHVVAELSTYSIPMMLIYTTKSDSDWLLAEYCDWLTYENNEQATLLVNIHYWCIDFPGYYHTCYCVDAAIVYSLILTCSSVRGR